MAWTRGASLFLAGLIVTACGTTPTSVRPSPSASQTATVTRQPELTPSPHPSPSPSPEPSPTPAVATMKCSGGPATAMVVLENSFVYDVVDPIHPRLICRGTDTAIHLLDSNAIAYTTYAGGHDVIIRRDLTTGAESRIAQLRTDQKTSWSAGFTWDGLSQVYSTSVPSANDHWLESVHIWSNGADRVVYKLDAHGGGIESRWAQRSVLEFSPDNAYVAISDNDFYIYGEHMRIFSLADKRQKVVIASASSGGTWIANDRFVWADLGGKLYQWTPTGGNKLLRSEGWYGVSASSDAKWLATTLIAPVNFTGPRTFFAPSPLGTGRTFRTGLASQPGWVTPTVAWYAEEERYYGPAFGCIEPCVHPTNPNGRVHALDVVNQTDRIVTFRAGETPKIPGASEIWCCSTQ